MNTQVPDVVPPLNLEMLGYDSAVDESNLPDEEGTESDAKFDCLLTDVVMADDSLDLNTQKAHSEI